MSENGSLLSRVVDPPGTKGGPRAENFPGPPKNTFCPGWSHDPGQRVVDSPGTKGPPPFVSGEATTRDKRAFCPGSWLHPGQKVFLGGPGKFPARDPPLVPGGSTTRAKRVRFPSFPPNIVFVFVFFTSLFKIGFHLLIQLINFDSKNYGTKFLISI